MAYRWLYQEIDDTVGFTQKTALQGDSNESRKLLNRQRTKDLYTAQWLTEEDLKLRDETDDQVTSLRVSVLSLQLTELTSAFDDGFLGYSMEVTVGKVSQETHPADVRGNHTEWKATFVM